MRLQALRQKSDERAKEEKRQEEALATKLTLEIDQPFADRKKHSL
jgi:hypothetical protein